MIGCRPILGLGLARTLASAPSHTLRRDHEHRDGVAAIDTLVAN